VQAHTKHTHTKWSAIILLGGEKSDSRAPAPFAARAAAGAKSSAARRSATPTNTMRRQFCGELAVKSWKTSRLILLVSFPALLSKEEKRRRREKLLRRYWNSSAPISLGTNVQFCGHLRSSQHVVHCNAANSTKLYYKI